MKTVFLLIVAGLAGLVLLAGFLRLERAGRRMATVLVIFGLVLVEAWIYPNQSLIPAGLFHPVLGGGATSGGLESGLSFRLPEILVPIALLARLLVRGRSLRLQAASLWWLAFLAWLATAGVIGIENGHSLNLALFEAKAIAYIGFFLLVAGVPAEEFAHGRAFRRFLYGASVLAAIGIVLSELKMIVVLSIPGIPINGMGPMSADAATIFLALGLMAVAIAICSERDRSRLLVASAPLLFTSVVAEQRAALLALVVAFALFAVAVVSGWKRVRSTPTELALGASMVVALLLVPVLITAAVGRRQPTVPFASTVNAAFDTQAKRLSAQDRLNQWDTARALISQHPVIGSGLGFTYQHYDPGYKTFITTNITHNIALDLLMRVGAVGLALFLVALLATLADGVRAWFRHPDALVAAVAMASVCALTGLAAKGMVESIFEKYRLAMLLGFLVGVIVSSRLSVATPRRERITQSAKVAIGRPIWS
jgi:O-antigen ligase